eukprot:104513-Pleurochrysis_carterae.AAC.1
MQQLRHLKGVLQALDQSDRLVHLGRRRVHFSIHVKLGDQHSFPSWTGKAFDGSIQQPGYINSIQQPCNPALLSTRCMHTSGDLR